MSTTFEVAYTPGSRDCAGHFMGATEMRALVPYSGILFAGNGYWEDVPGPESLQGAQVLALDSSSSSWQVELQLNTSYLAISALADVQFPSASAGLLMASAWNTAGYSDVFTRQDTTRAWTRIPVAFNAPGAGQSLAQICSLGVHTDAVTGVSMVFAGQSPNGIYSGVFNASVSGFVQWGTEPELNISTINISSFPGLSLAVTSFAVLNNVLYATVGQQIYKRIDGTSPTWALVYTNPTPGYSQTGLRGLSVVGSNLVVAVEGTQARIAKLNPTTWTDTTENNLITSLSAAWNVDVSYVKAAYNNMTLTKLANGQEVYLIGLNTYLAAGSSVPSGFATWQSDDGLLVANASYLIRSPSATYTIMTIPPMTTQSMVSTRSIAVSPFSDNNLYFSGFDANNTTVHDTAWIVSSTIAAST